MTTPTIQWNEAAQAVEAAQIIVLATHFHPDGDAIGSMLGLANALWARGKNVQVAVDGGVPKFLEYVPGSDRVIGNLNAGEWDLFISLDSSDNERTGDAGIYARAHSKTVINLDHHATNTYFGDIHLVMPTAVSATEVVYEWLRHMGDPISENVAIPLLTGLVTDTMGFRTSNVLPSTLQIAQVLIEAGASLPKIMRSTLNSHPYVFVEVWKQALPTIQIEGGVISGEITQAHIKAVGLDEVPDTGLVSWMISTDEAQISVLFKEQNDGTVEIGLRSKVGYDVAKVAFAFGGGGHKQASGASVRGTLEEVKARVLPVLRQTVADGAQPVA